MLTGSGWQPKLAKWKTVVNKEDVIYDERGIQLSNCARHLNDRTLSWWDSASNGGMQWNGFLVADLNIPLSRLPMSKNKL